MPLLRCTVPLHRCQYRRCHLLPNITIPLTTQYYDASTIDAPYYAILPYHYRDDSTVDATYCAILPYHDTYIYYHAMIPISTTVP
ncbi:hypothetical protein CEXT_81101 [Caerostris extrusa]|uniref:Uncharacterized protein n=1 Tax=Caerostris extrusa TaxID=172846 RepID=A0AAV4S5F1_CAEEX|nr:hypothetical protein CEXT_81101 [Caerostris extrusa]